VDGRPAAALKPENAPLIYAFAFAADGAAFAARFQAHPGAYNFLFAGEGGIVRVSAAGVRGAAIPFAGIVRLAISGDGTRFAALGQSHFSLLDEAGRLIGEMKLRQD
jgi:hypothetical protein